MEEKCDLCFERRLQISSIKGTQKKIQILRKAPDEVVFTKVI